MIDGWSRRSVVGSLVAAGAAGLVGRPLPASAQAGGGLLEQLRKNKVAKVAIAAQPPFSEMRTDGTITGMGPTVSQIVMERLGVPKLEGIVVPYGEIIPGLMAGRWDFVAACLSITKVRCKQVLYSDPIVFDAAVLAYLPVEMPSPPTSIEAIGKNGLKVGLINGAYLLQQVHAVASTDNIVIFPDVPALIDGMLSKRVQVALATYTGFVAMQAARSTAFTISPPLTDAHTAGSGPAFRPKDTDLFDAFEAEVKAMKKSGEIAQLSQQFGFQYVRDKYDSITMSEACEMAI